MSPTLKSGTTVLALKIFSKRLLKRGQIVVFDAGLDHEALRNHNSNNYLIKRLIGLEYDEIVLSKGNFKWNTSEDKYTIQERPRVPKDHFFVQSDNFGLDSRHFGPVPYKRLKGIVLRKISG